MLELKMKPTYKIFILDEDEFNGLHKYIPEVSEKDLKEGQGFANPRTKECYVKRSGIKELDDLTIIHEAEELLAKHSEHEIDGIRWKKGGVARFIVPALLSLVPGVGPILAAASSVGMGQYAQSQHPEQLGAPSVLSALGQAATGYFGGKALAGGVSGGIQGGTQAGAGLIEKAGGIVSGVAKGAITGSSGINTNILGTTPTGVTAGVPGISPPTLASGAQITPFFPGQTAAQVAANPIYGTGSSLLGSALSSGISSTLAPSTQGVSQVAPTIAPTTTPATSVTTAAPKTLLEQAKGLVTPQNILGAGSLLASTAGKTPEFTMPSSFTDLQGKLMQGGALSPLGQQAQSELSNILKSTPQELYPTASDAYYQAALRRTRESYVEAGKQLDAAYNMAGVYGSGEHLAAKDKLQQQLTNAEADLYAQTEQRRFELATTEKYNAIQTALGVDQYVMNDLLGLTGLDVSTAASMYNAQVADVEEIRKALGTLGSELLVRGTTGQMQGGQGVTINLGK